MPLSILEDLTTILKDSSRPSFLFGTTPPRENTSEEKARQTCQKFASRSAVLAIDGFIIYDIQDEISRTTVERPFPFRKTISSSWYASLFPTVSGRQCVVYKSVVEESMESYIKWLDQACNVYGHTAFNLVGAASSKLQYRGPNLQEASLRTKQYGNCSFGCVCIPERHVATGGEALNMIRKTEWGADWFITQGIYAAEPVVKLINEYGDSCRQREITPKKIILTFAPCGRPKTMTFIKWLGIYVPQEVESRILSSTNPCQASIEILCECLVSILQATSGSGVPLGINVESLSIYKEEIDAAHNVFQLLQAILLNSKGSPWAVRWFRISEVEKLVQYMAQNKNELIIPVRRPSPCLLVGGDASSSSSADSNSKECLEFKVLVSSTDPTDTSAADTTISSTALVVTNSETTSSTPSTTTTTTTSTSLGIIHLSTTVILSMCVGAVIGSRFASSTRR